MSHNFEMSDCSGLTCSFDVTIYLFVEAPLPVLGSPFFDPSTMCLYQMSYVILIHSGWLKDFFCENKTVLNSFSFVPPLLDSASFQWYLNLTEVLLCFYFIFTDMTFKVLKLVSTSFMKCNSKWCNVPSIKFIWHTTVSPVSMFLIHYGEKQKQKQKKTGKNN